MSGRSVPFGVKLQAVKKDVTLPTCLAGTLNLERKGLVAISKCLARGIRSSVLPGLARLHQHH